MKNIWALQRFAAVDRKDIDGFVNMLTDDHRFHFGARPAIIGKSDARAAVVHFWTMIGRLRHNIWRVREAGNIAYVEALIEYERLDGKVVLVPCCDVMVMRDGQFCEQRAYLDQGAIFAPDLTAAGHVYKDRWIDEIPTARAALGLGPKPEII
jgi:ketosteroid isomerase-like protein